MRYPDLRGIADEILHYVTGVLVTHFGTGVLGHWAPGYDALLGGTFALAGPHPVAAKVLQVGLSTLAIPLVYGLARAQISRRAAGVAALLVAVDPTLAAFSHYLFPETLFIALLLAAVLALFRRPDARTRADLVTAGLLFGLTTLTRSVALYFLLAWAAFAALRGRRREALQAATVFAVALAVVLPWTLRNAFKYETFLLVDGTLARTAYFAFSEGFFNRDLGYLHRDAQTPEREPCSVGEAPGAPALPPVDELVEIFPEGMHGLLGRREPKMAVYRARTFATLDVAAEEDCELERGLAFARAHPGTVAGHVLHRFYAFWGPNSYLLRWVKHGFYGDGPLAQSSYAWLKPAVVAWHVALVVCAVLAFGRRRLSPVLVFAALFVAYYTAIHMLAVAHSRYRLPVMPFVMLAASSWLAEPRLPEGRARMLGVLAVLVGFLALAAHYAWVRLP